MQLGSSAGAILAEWLPTSARERRLLFVAGIGAGISAVFRTPLGAALLAVEVLYRDDFDAEALVPSVLASVVSFSVSSSILGSRPLFGTMPPHPFVVGHLPFYAALAVVAATAGAAFVWALHGVRDLAQDSRIPRWMTPALGGLVLGVSVVAVYALGASRMGPVPSSRHCLVEGTGWPSWLSSTSLDRLWWLPDGYSLLPPLGLAQQRSRWGAEGVQETSPRPS